MPKSKQIPRTVRSPYEFIKAHRDQYSVQVMCRVLEVVPRGYYDWLLQRASRVARRRIPDHFAGSAHLSP